MSQSTNFTMEDILNSSDNKLIMFILGQGNVGAYTVITKLFEIVENDETKYTMIINLIKNLISKKIVGVRLWYIYKNEAKLNVNNLLSINLDQFTDEYFYEKIERYF